VIKIEPEFVFRLSVLHFQSPRQLFISMLAQQHSTLQHNKDVGPSIDAREVSFLLAIRTPLFRNCLLCIPSHARRGQTAGLRGGTALYNYTPRVRLFILVLFLGQLIPTF
jgi:hypothetical protein